MVIQNSARQSKDALIVSTSAPSCSASEEMATATPNAEPASEPHYGKSAISTTDTSRTTSASIHADGAAPRLMPWVRYRDLYEANIVRSWAQLSRMIDSEGFPVGKMLSPNVRAWRLDEVEAWLAHQPASRKVPPPATKRPGRDGVAS
jgi:hypothetical protein